LARSVHDFAQFWIKNPKNCIFQNFGHTFSRNPLDRFWNCFANRKCVRPAIDPENLNKIAIPQFEQISFEKVTFSKAKIF